MNLAPAPAPPCDGGTLCVWLVGWLLPVAYIGILPALTTVGMQDGSPFALPADAVSADPAEVAMHLSISYYICTIPSSAAFAVVMSPAICLMWRTPRALECNRSCAILALFDLTWLGLLCTPLTIAQHAHAVFTGLIFTTCGLYVADTHAAHGEVRDARILPLFALAVTSLLLLRIALFRGVDVGHLFFLAEFATITTVVSVYPALHTIRRRRLEASALAPPS